MAEHPASESVERHRKRKVSHRRKQPPKAGLSWPKAAVLLGILLVVLLGGGAPIWVQGCLLLCIGCFWIFAPPRESLSRTFDYGVGAFLLVGLLSFFPVLGERAEWWHAVVGQLGIALPAVLSAQPWVSLETFFSLLGGIAVFYALWNWKVSDRERLGLLWMFGIISGVLALAVSIGSFIGIKYPMGAMAESFSFFNNRNQTSILLCMGGLVTFGLAMQGLRLKQPKSVWAILVTLIILVGLLSSLSRAGVMLFFAGCIVWFLLRVRTGRITFFFKFAVPVFILGLGLLVLYGGPTMARFNLWSGDESGEFRELRIPIYQDSVQMISEQPLLGVGLGNFRYVFPQYREGSRIFESIIHPESDWMWVATEMGLIGVGLLLFLVILAVRRSLHFNEESSSAASRTTACVALGAFGVHTCVDVSGHTWATLLVAFLLYRLSVTGGGSKSVPFILPRWLVRFVGVVMCLVGSAWALSDWTGLPGHTMVRSQTVRELMRSESGKEAEVQAALETALAAQPLNWLWYAERGRRLAGLEKPEAALKDFRRARFLEPVSTPVVYYEAIAWLEARQWDYAFIALREMLYRKDAKRDDLFRRILELQAGNRGFRGHMSRLTALDPDLRIAYLNKLKGDRFKEEIKKDIAEDPLFSSYTAQQKQMLFKNWAVEGDTTSLFWHLRHHSEVVELPWYYTALAFARENDPTRAVSTVLPHMAEVEVPSVLEYENLSLGELLRYFKTAPHDLLRGTAVLQKQLTTEDWEGALKTLEMLAAQKDPPLFVWYWQGELLRRRGEYFDAWKAWARYLESTLEA